MTSSWRRYVDRAVEGVKLTGAARRGVGMSLAPATWRLRVALPGIVPDDAQPYAWTAEQHLVFWAGDPITPVEQTLEAQRATLRGVKDVVADVVDLPFAAGRWLAGLAGLALVLGMIALIWSGKR